MHLIYINVGFLHNILILQKLIGTQTACFPLSYIYHRLFTYAMPFENCYFKWLILNIRGIIFKCKDSSTNCLLCWILRSNPSSSKYKYFDYNKKYWTLSYLFIGNLLRSFYFFHVFNIKHSFIRLSFIFVETYNEKKACNHTNIK